MHEHSPATLDFGQGQVYLAEHAGPQRGPRSWLARGLGREACVCARVSKRAHVLSWLGEDAGGGWCGGGRVRLGEGVDVFMTCHLDLCTPSKPHGSGVLG